MQSADTTVAKQRKSNEVMDDELLKGVLQGKLRQMLGSELEASSGSEIARQRELANEYLEGRIPDPVSEGTAQVVSTDVSDAIEWFVASVMELLRSSDQLVEFEPELPEDDDSYELASEYVHHIIWHDNHGYRLLHDLIKGAAIYKASFAKVVWEDREWYEARHLTGLTEFEVNQLTEDDDVEITHAEVDDEAELEAAPGVFLQLPLYDLRIRRRKPGQIVVSALPPEEYMIARRNYDVENADAQVHLSARTMTDLKQLGFDTDGLDAVGGGRGQDFSAEKISRLESEEEWPLDLDETDPSMRRCWTYDFYLQIDYDGDGVAEYRNIFAAGRDLRILENQETAHNPFVKFEVMRQPWKFFGKSFVDLVGEVQVNKTALIREAHDNAFLANNQRTVVSPIVKYDDLLDDTPGGYVRMKEEYTNVPANQAMAVMGNENILNHIEPLIRYWDETQARRSGIDPNTLDANLAKVGETAAGVAMVLTSKQVRQRFFTHLISETGILDLYKKVLQMVIEHQDKPRMLKMNGRWVEVDPRSWNANMKAKPSINIGFGTREQQLGAALQAFQMSLNILQLSDKMDEPIVLPKHLREAMREVYKAIGYRNTDRFMTTEEEAAQAAQAKQKEPPDPRIVVEKMRQQIEGKKLELESARIKIEAAKAERQDQIKMLELQARQGTEQAQLQHQQDKDLAGVIGDKERRQIEVMKAQKELQMLDLEADRLALDHDVKSKELDYAMLKAEAEIQGDQARTEIAAKEHRAEMEKIESQRKLDMEKIELEKAKQKTERLRIEQQQRELRSEINSLGTRLKAMEKGRPDVQRTDKRKEPRDARDET